MEVTLRRTPDSLHSHENVDKMPVYPGGETAMNDFIEAHKGHFTDDEKPTKELEIQLVIASNGHVSSVGADPFLNERIQKDIAHIFKSMPEWTPGMKDGKPVAVITYAKMRY